MGRSCDAAMLYELPPWAQDILMLGGSSRSLFFVLQIPPYRACNN